jgi:hypothetical protein
MQSHFSRTSIEVLYRMAKQGLIHRRRTCMACFKHPMLLIHSLNTPHHSQTTEYLWKCSFCYYTCSISKSTVLSAVDIQGFDTALSLWMVNCKTANAARIVTERAKRISTAANRLFKLFRKAHSHYVELNVLPYL